MPSTPTPQKIEVKKAEVEVDRSLDEFEAHMSDLADKLEEEVKPVMKVITFPQKAIKFLKSNKLALTATATALLGGWFYLKTKKRSR